MVHLDQPGTTIQGTNVLILFHLQSRSYVVTHMDTHTHTHAHTHTHRNDSLGSTELASKLEPAFLCGLRCSQVQIRSRFFDVYNTSVQKRLFERLLYLMCSQNWEHCGGYFWIKHCLEVRV